MKLEQKALNNTFTHTVIGDKLYSTKRTTTGGAFMKPEISKDIIRGHTTTIILNILSQGDSYGYEIAKAVRELSHDAYELNEATLYTAFRRMERNGDIESYWGDETHGGRRKYYKLTEQGTRLLAKNVADWAFAKKIIDDLITGRIDDNGHN